MSPSPDLAAFRADFPALRRRRNGRPPIYLNNACTTLRPTPVIDAIRGYYERFPTCGGGRAEGEAHLRNWFMEELREEEVRARGTVARFVGAADPAEIVWTRNTTEAINLVARGLPLEPGDEVLQSEREHNSNLVPWLEVERRLRKAAGDPSLRVRRTFALGEDGRFDLERALAAVGPRTKVISIPHSSNLDGVETPDDAVRALARRIHAQGGVLFLDAAQSVPHRPVDATALEVDFLAFSFHKMCGPAGMGALYGRRDALLRLAPFLTGGDTVRDTWQDRVVFKDPPARFEAGLQDYAGILGAAAAVEYVTDVVGVERIGEHLSRLNTHLTERLRPLLSDRFWILGPEDPSLRGGILTMGASTGAVVNAIERLADEEANVMMRKGMFCANAWLHSRFDRSGHAHDHLRASLYLYNTEDELDLLADVVRRVVEHPLDHLDDE